ncbi:MAG: hypothetical protein OIF38_00505, partial [Cellvibrionaceae bacterium]|nr:hypothetical protein [Cellvibrionaceae bacterium]
ELSGNSSYFRDGKSLPTDGSPGIWMGRFGGKPYVSFGDANSGFKYDPVNKARFKGKLEISSGSTGYAALTDAPENYRYSGYRYQFSGAAIPGGIYNDAGVEITKAGHNPRSYVLSIYDRVNRRWLSHTVYDVWSGAAVASSLAAALNAQDKTKIIVLTGQHAPAPGRTTNGMLEAVLRCGGSKTIF